MSRRELLEKIASLEPVGPPGDFERSELQNQISDLMTERDALAARNLELEEQADLRQRVFELEAFLRQEISNAVCNAPFNSTRATELLG